LEVAHRPASIHRRARITSLVGEWPPKMARRVPRFVAANPDFADTFGQVIRCEAGTSGTERRATDEPTIPSRVRRKCVPRRWCLPRPPYDASPLRHSP
jgi:hypothetical protein